MIFSLNTNLFLVLIDLETWSGSKYQINPVSKQNDIDQTQNIRCLN